MKHRDIPVYAIFDFLYIVVASVAAWIFAGMAVKFANLLTEVSFVAEAIVSLAVMEVVYFGLVGFFAYMSGYREGKFDKVESTASASVSALLYFLLGLLFTFVPILFGATRYIAGFIAFGGNYNDIELVAETPMWCLAVVGLLHAALTVGLMVAFHFFGFRKRLSHREELTGAKTTQK